jgi:UDP-glucose 4-epimerase
VTGGAGFIGSHLVDALLADAATVEVRILDNFSSGRYGGDPRPTPGVDHSTFIRRSGFGTCDVRGV